VSARDYANLVREADRVRRARAARRAAIDQVLERINSDNRYHGVHNDHAETVARLEAEILAVSAGADAVLRCWSAWSLAVWRIVRVMCCCLLQPARRLCATPRV
jgi:hypothetical protein